MYSDKKSLGHLLHQRITTTTQKNWLAKLLAYQFEVIYKPGPDNKATDSLSRMFEDGELKEIQSFPIWLQEQHVQNEVKLDPFLQQVVQKLQQGDSSVACFSIHRGVLFYKNRLVLSAKSSLIPTILTEFHSSPAGGHSGFLRTYKRIVGNVYWIGMKGMVQEFVKACEVYQCQKYEATSLAGLLQPLPILDRIWEDVSLYFIIGLPKSKGFQAILVVVDRLSK